MYLCVIFPALFVSCGFVGLWVCVLGFGGEQMSTGFSVPDLVLLGRGLQEGSAPGLRQRPALLEADHSAMERPQRTQ